MKSEGSDPFQPGKVLEIVEHVSSSFSYCRIYIIAFVLREQYLFKHHSLFDSPGINDNFL